ncbi:MAG: hypothetical protein NZ901_04965 [Geminocystis sp.]|nr:hypothetical protein [Geminocystis sp.]HIK38522.1 hypothetical protein [Geminocystis sp. M7585_C2015_104]MCS7147525.1 hypothetical protein [Geminocystis sp.]MCX8077928.1 hypothetical protein [Geminocystis sp.]MDW8115218.1 hypothetical protein [Geminocystis sp.]
MAREVDSQVHIGKIGELPLDNYRVDINTITEMVEETLLENPKLSGVFVTKKNEVVATISRRVFFEKMSREYARDIYSKRPIKVLVRTLDYKPLTIPADTEINEAVKLALRRAPEYVYEPVVVTKEDEYMGMLELSVLILAEANIFSEINQMLVKQGDALKNYAERLEKEKKVVSEYAKELENQREQLKKTNKLLEKQAKQLEEQQKDLELRNEEISRLNKRFSEVGVLLSEEGKKTLDSLEESVEKVVALNQQISLASSGFKYKFRMINQATELVSQISKRVEFLSQKVGRMVSGISSEEKKRLPFDMVTQEIEKLSVQINQASSTINNVAEELRREINNLSGTAEENQKIVKNLARNFQSIQTSLAKLTALIEGREEKND